MKSTLPRLILLASIAFFRADLVAAEPSADSPQAALVEAQAKLEELKQRFADTHPSVIEQKTKIAALKARVDLSSNPEKSAKEIHINLDFPGGTVADLLNLLAKNDAVSFNLIGEKALMSTELPPFSLRNASLMSIYEVLKRFLLTRGLLLDLAAPGHDSVVCVLTHPEPKPLRQIAPPVLFDSFQLWPYLEHQTVDDIVAAIRAAWELEPSHNQADLKLKYHPATSILLASGSSDALQTARNVLGMLKRTAEKSPKPSEKTNPSPAPDKR